MGQGKSKKARDGRRTGRTWRHMAAALAAATLLSGCGEGSGAPAQGGVEQTNGSLTISIAEGDQDMYKRAFDEFRERYPDVDLQVETYPDGRLAQEIKRQQTEVMAGEGPDILMFKCYETDDLYKMMKAGAFANMDAYIEADGTWGGGADYVQGALDAGKFGGSQYVMPLSFYGMCMVASQEGLDAAGVSTEDCRDALSIMQRRPFMTGGIRNASLGTRRSSPRSRRC